MTSRWGCGARLLAVFLLALGFALLLRQVFIDRAVVVRMVVNSPQHIGYQVFFRDDQGNYRPMTKGNHFIGRDEQIVFPLPTKRIEELRIDFGQYIYKGPVVLRRLEINGKPVPLPEVARLGRLNQMDILSASADGLSLDARRDDPYLVLPASLASADAQRQMAFWPFVSVLVVGWIFFLALVNRFFPSIACGKDWGARLDLLFLSAVFLLLILPATRWNWEEVDPRENRPLARFPDFRKESLMDGSFSKQFGLWVNDRFGWRDRFLALERDAELALTAGHYENDNAFMGEDYWLFNKQKQDDSVELYQRRRNFSADQMKDIQKNLESQKAWLARQGIGYFVFVAPNKADVYGEYYKQGVLRVEPEDRIEALSAYLASASSDIGIIYPLDALLAQKPRGKLYWKAGTHWTDYAAYVGYLALMEAIQREYPAAHPLGPEEVHWHEEKGGRIDLWETAIALERQFPEFEMRLTENIIERTRTFGDGALFDFLNLEDESPYRQDDYLYPDFVRGQHYQYVMAVRKYGGPVTKLRTKNPEKPYKVVVFHDSFMNAMLPFLSESFGEVLYVWDLRHGKDIYADLVREEHPDFVVHEMAGHVTDVLLEDTLHWQEEN